ncbi:peptidylprolyl isomerase [Paenibacillus sp. IHBB 10380]|uniref:peptidylprolyl isomerase n=1 Tax=Paenibacillus sp. IHBB 10380 TaxID=1566358 RepID=UPI0006991552|nr:peptidylprolyl isomerase [Paenibacillus sp. IHBB 10380]
MSDKDKETWNEKEDNKEEKSLENTSEPLQEQTDSVSHPAAEELNGTVDLSSADTSDSVHVGNESEPLDVNPVTPTQPVDYVEPSSSGDPDNGNRSTRIWIGVSLVLAIILVVVLIRPPFNGSNQDNSDAVATVNNVNISKDKLYDALVVAGGAQTLDSLITEELIEQEAVKAKITVTDADFDKEIATIKKNFPTEEAFNEALGQAGMTLANLKDQMKPKVKIRKILEPKVTVTDADVKQNFEDNKATYDTAEQVRASHILVATKAEAEAILKELKAGGDFAAIAKEKSIDPGSKDAGGDLDFFARGAMVEPFEKVAFALKKDELSGVVSTTHGFHIIKLTDRKEAHKATLEEKSADIREQLVTAKVSEMSATWLAEIKEKATIKNTLEEKAAVSTGTTAPTTDTAK